MAKKMSSATTRRVYMCIDDQCPATQPCVFDVSGVDNKLGPIACPVYLKEIQTVAARYDGEFGKDDAF